MYYEHTITAKVMFRIQNEAKNEEHARELAYELMHGDGENKSLTLQFTDWDVRGVKGEHDG